MKNSSPIFTDGARDLLAWLFMPETNRLCRQLGSAAVFDYVATVHGRPADQLKPIIGIIFPE